MLNKSGGIVGGDQRMNEGGQNSICCAESNRRLIGSRRQEKRTKVWTPDYLRL